jgi:hypothetical protein
MRLKVPLFGVAALAAMSLAACGLNEPGVGKCTNAKLTMLVEADVKVVDCGSVDATSKITRETDTAAECKFMSLQTAGRVFCAEPLPGMGK